MAFQISNQRLFYGWWIVAAAAAGLAVHFGPIVVGTFGVFLLAPKESSGLAALSSRVRWRWLFWVSQLLNLEWAELSTGSVRVR